MNILHKSLLAICLAAISVGNYVANQATKGNKKLITGSNDYS